MKAMISKSFLKGYIRALNLNGMKQWPDLSESKKRDYEALRSDWENVGRDIREGEREYERSNRK